MPFLCKKVARGIIFSILTTIVQRGSISKIKPSMCTPIRKKNHCIRRAEGKNFSQDQRAKGKELNNKDPT